MKHPEKTGKRRFAGGLRTVALLGAVGLAAAAGGAATALWGVGVGSTYTEPDANPSASRRPMDAIAPAERRAPVDFAFTDAQGRTGRLSDFKGRVVLVNLWATWCPPCVAEMPDLNALQKSKGDDDFQVAAISLDRAGKPVVDQWFARARIDALAAYTADPKDFPGALLPTSILLDRQGLVAWTGSGIYPWVGPQAVRLIEQIKAEPR